MSRLGCGCMPPHGQGTTKVLMPGDTRLWSSNQERYTKSTVFSRYCHTASLRLGFNSIRPEVTWTIHTRPQVAKMEARLRRHSQGFLCWGGGSKNNCTKIRLQCRGIWSMFLLLLRFNPSHPQDITFCTPPISASTSSWFQYVYSHYQSLIGGCSYCLPSKCIQSTQEQPQQTSRRNPGLDVRSLS